MPRFLLLLYAMTTATVQNPDLAGSPMYLKGTANNAKNGLLQYTEAHAGDRRIELVMPIDGAVDNRITVGICPGDGNDAACGGGISLGNFGDTVLLGSSGGYHVLNTRQDSIGLQLGAGVTNVQQDAFVLFNDARFTSDASEMTASSGVQSFMHLAGTVNQSGTAGYKMLYIEDHETSTGSGGKYLISAGTNANTSGSMIGSNVLNGTDNTNYTAKWVLQSDGKVGFLTPLPTHTITLAQNGTWASYNTSDQTTNYERAVGFWTSNVYVMQAQKGGSGTSRAIEMVSSDGSGVVANDFGDVGFLGSSSGYTGLSMPDGIGVSINGRLASNTNQANVRIQDTTFGTAFSAASGTQRMLQVIGTINQSSTAGYTGLEVNVTEGSTGSGAKLPLNVIVAAASKFNVDNNGVVATAGVTTGTNQVGAVFPGNVAFASLSGSATNGQIVYCNNCTIANPCATSGTGALAKRLNGVWVCN